MRYRLFEKWVCFLRTHNFPAPDASFAAPTHRVYTPQPVPSIREQSQRRLEMNIFALKRRLPDAPANRTAVLFCALLALVATATGCSKKDDGPTVMTLEGKIEKLDLNADGTGELTVLYYSEKHNQDALGTALITPETEVLIDGVIATVKEIHLGERVRGDVRVDKKGNKKTQTVVKIYVTRPKTEG